MNNPLLVAGSYDQLNTAKMNIADLQDPAADTIPTKEETETEEDSDSEDDSDDDSSDEDDSDYDSDDSDDSSYWDENEMEDLEAALRLGGRQPDMKRSLSSPAMAAVFDASGPLSRTQTIDGMKDLARRMRKSTTFMQAPTQEPAPATVDDPLAQIKPDDFLRDLLEGIGASSFPSETWHDYFQTMEPEHVENYTTDMVMAIRNDDYDVLRERLRLGQTLQCCNHHGESIVHLACRRGSHDMLRFLMEEAQVSVRIRDDKGRTPLHDACWNTAPNFPLIYALLESSPELLFVQDHRGHTPLSYAPKRVWGEWNAFLQKNRVFLRASVRSLRFDRAKYLVRNIVPCMKTTC